MSVMISTPLLNASMLTRSTTCSVSSEISKGMLSSLNSLERILVKSSTSFASCRRTFALNSICLTYSVCSLSSAVSSSSSVVLMIVWMGVLISCRVLARKRLAVSRELSPIP